MSSINIPKYEQENSVHQDLAKHSLKAHSLAHRDSNKLAQIEDEIDRLSCMIWNLTDDDLRTIKNELKT